MPVEVDIILATYNGGKYLDEQLESIFEQDFHDYRVLIRDDGSTDHTLDILSKWKGLNPQKIEFIEDKLGNLGPTKNFNQLLEASTAPYICFCDQDDKWLPIKLSSQIKFIKSLEEKHPHTGLMIFSDLIMCDQDMNVICPSLIEKDRLNTKALKPNQLLMQNVPYGCTTMINRKLLAIVTPIDSRALLHDHWMAIVASLLGEIYYQDEVLIYHRIHEKNASRAESEHRKETKKDFKSKINNDNFNNYLNKQVDQAQAILDKYQQHLTEHDQKILKEFILLKSTSGIKRKWIIINNKFFKNTVYNTFKLILRA
jgi:glycosyltransferase involved in cell wall biosynthesis